MFHRDTTSPRTRVWGLAVRGFHWSLALLLLGAFLTGDDDDTSALHVRLGLAVVGVLIFRVVWGFVGPRHARFRDFVRAPREVLAYAKAYVRGRPPPHAGHNPLGGVMVVVMLLVVAALAGTGVLVRLGPEWSGPLTPWMSFSSAHAIAEVHEALAGTLLVLIALHVVGVVLSSWVEGQNLVGGMITGWKRTSERVTPMSAPRRAAAFLVAAITGAGAALGLAQLVGGGGAEAAGTPQALLEAYAGEARRAFDPARGKELYASCTECHTADPRQPGRTPAGKVIEPLAPSASPDRFTDRGKADKWFARNCKQVIGRECTAEEKGDLLAWLLTL